MAEPPKPMPTCSPYALDEAGVERRAAPDVGEGRVGELEGVFPVVREEADPHLPHLGVAVGRDRPAHRLPGLAFFRVEEHVQPRAEDPEVPGIVVRLGVRHATRAQRTRGAGGHLEILPQRRLGGVPYEAETQHLGQRASLAVVGVVLGRVEDQLVIHAREVVEAVEIERPRVAAAAGVLAGDQHVNLRVPPVAHVVHEGDLAAQVLVVARTAVEENAEQIRAVRFARLLRRAGDSDAERNRQQTRQHRLHRHLRLIHTAGACMRRQPRNPRPAVSRRALSNASPPFAAVWGSNTSVK